MCPSMALPGCRSESPCPRQSMTRTERPRATSLAATRPYFSANSVRPGKITAVPCVPPRHTTARSRTPSEAVSQ